MAVIMRARKEEVKVLQDLNDELFQDNSKYDPDLKIDWAKSEEGKKYFTKILNNPKAICLIAKDNKKSIGYIAASPKKMSWRLSKYLEIENMFVSPNYRCRGIGSKLISECLTIAKKKGYQKAYVASYYSNKRATAFYKKSGFTKIDISLERDI